MNDFILRAPPFTFEDIGKAGTHSHPHPQQISRLVVMSPPHPPVGGLPESKLRRSPLPIVQFSWACMVGLSLHTAVLLNQNRAAQRVKDRAKARERALQVNDSSATLVATKVTKSIKGFLKGRRDRKAETTSTTPPARLRRYIPSGPPSPLPGIYGTILSRRH